MKNIHVLPTDKPSRLYYNSNQKHYRFNFNVIRSSNCIENQNIYITSDEEIKVGDWVYSLREGLEPILKQKVSTIGVNNDEMMKKIILTTDQDLIKDGVQAINDDFLEWFVKNPKSENVYVYKKYKQVNQNNPVTRGSTALGFSHYEVQSLDLSAPIGTSEKEIDILELGQIIPKEEPKQICDNCKIEISKYGCACGGKPKQETLEEFAEKEAIKLYLENTFGNIIVRKSIEKGAKWQQERMYSEEEVELIANEMVNWSIDNVGNPNAQSGKKFDEVLNKFKNINYGSN